MRAPKEIDAKLFLFSYAIAPVFLALVFIDYVFLDGALKKSLPSNPESIPFWTYLFVFPHIISSLIIFADTEYIKYYKFRLVITALIAYVLAVIIPKYFGSTIGILIFASFTCYHAVMQQFGLALILLKQKPNRDYQIFKYLTVIPVTVTFIQGYFVNLTPINYLEIIKYTLMVVISISLYFAYKFYKKNLQTKKLSIGHYFYLANAVTVIVLFVFFIFGYPIFMLVLPRLIHDCTAFIIYINHDSNRNNIQAKNLIYKLIKLPPILICIPLGVIGYKIFDIGLRDTSFYTTFFLYISYLHYVCESYVWKGGTLHRQHLRVGLS